MRPQRITALILLLIVATTSHAYAMEAGFTAPHSWRIERNKICFDEHSHVGGAEAMTKRAAHKAAIREWREFTAWEYGSVWASYKRASGKSVEYTKAAVGWFARVYARPCRLKPRRRHTSRRR